MRENVTLNILQLSRTMGQGGAEKVVLQLCSTLSCSQNHIYVASTGGYFVEELNKMNIKNFNIPDMEDKSLSTIIKIYSILANIVEKYHIDIIHTHHRMAAFYARLLKFRFKNLKHIYTAHNVFYDHKHLLDFALKNATIIACGDSVKSNLVNFYGINSANINVIYNSVSISSNGIHETQKKLPRKGNYYIGCIGRLTKQKGIDIFIKAIARDLESNSNIKGVIIGDGVERKNLERLVQKLNVEDSIIFLGYQSDVYYWINQVEFIVLSSRWEGLPLTPIEAFACKKTIIVSDIPSNIEIVENGYNGLTFKKNNDQDLADKILSMIKQKNRLEPQAYNTYIDKFSYSLFQKKYRDIYLRVFNTNI